MSNFGYALSKGLEAGFKSGSGLIADSIRNDERIEAEERAANRQLATEERLLAIREAAKNRAYERFSQIMRTKQGEEVPIDPASVAETGLTAEGAAAALGKRIYDGKEQDATGIQGSAGQVKQLVQRAKETLMNPSATEEQKADARGLIDQLMRQEKAQGEVNAKAVEGKTRKRTFDEVVEAARQDAALNEPAAFAAGEAMFAAERKEKREDQKLASREKIEAERNDQRAKEATYRDAQAERRHEEMMQRLEAQGKNAADTQNKQLQQQFAISMRQQIESIDRDIRELEKNKKNKLPEELGEINENIDEKKAARKQLVEMQTDYFKESGINVPTPREPKAESQKPRTTLNTLPAGAKKIGTSGGKPVYQLPDGSRFIEG